MSRFLAGFLGVANDTIKIVGFGKFWYGLEISAVFVLSQSLVCQVLFLSRSLGFFSARFRSLGYFSRASRNPGSLSDQTDIYFKDIVFGPQNI